jgi:hypothetical protein
MTPEDGLQALPSRVRRRLLGPKPRLTTRELTYLTQLDHRKHEALAAVDDTDGSIVIRARASGIGRLTATTQWDNWPARALLRRLGFRTAGESPLREALIAEISVKM